MQLAVQYKPLKENAKLKQEFSRQQLDTVDRVLQENRGRPGALIPVLKEIQDATGYLPAALQHGIARGLNISFSEVFGVVTFYSFFNTDPPGRHKIRVCLGTACYVRGNKALEDSIGRAIGCMAGGSTEDRRFSLEEVRCLGCCGIAPVIKVNEEVFREVQVKDLPRILEKFP